MVLKVVLRLALLAIGTFGSVNVSVANCDKDNCNDQTTPKRVITTQEHFVLTKPTNIDINNLPEDQKGIAAVARIFQLKYFMYPHTIEILSPKIAMIDGNTVEPLPSSRCTYRLRRIDGAVTAQIGFDKLSDEYRAMPINGATYLVINGQDKAVCEQTTYRPDGAQDGGHCFPSLILSLAPSTAMSALRALRYIFSNVCRPAEIPF